MTALALSRAGEVGDDLGLGLSASLTSGTSASDRETVTPSGVPYRSEGGAMA